MYITCTVMCSINLQTFSIIHNYILTLIICVCVCVCAWCVCVCVKCYSCWMINEVQARFSIGFYSHVFLDCNLWTCKIMLCSRVIARFAYFECHCSLFRTVRSKTCVHGVFLPYLVVSSAIERYLLELQEWERSSKAALHCFSSSH